jgi:hypothetical protein
MRNAAIIRKIVYVSKHLFATVATVRLCVICILSLWLILIDAVLARFHSELPHFAVQVGPMDAHILGG